MYPGERGHIGAAVLYYTLAKQPMSGRHDPPDPRSTKLRLPAHIRAGIDAHLCERTLTPGVLAKRAHLRELERPLLVW